MALSVRQKVNTGFGIALLLLSIIGFVSYRSTVQLVKTDALVAGTHRAIGELEALLSALENAESEQRAYIITGDLRDVANFDGTIAVIQQGLVTLEQRAMENPAQQARLARLNPLVQQRLERLKQVLDVRQRQGFEPARDLVRTRRGTELQAQITSLIREMEDEERALLQVRTERAAASASQATRIILLSSLLAFSFVSLAVLLINRDITRREAAEQELQLQRDFAVQVMNTMGQGLTVTDREGHFEYVNPAYAQMVGYTPEELIGRSPYDLSIADDHRVLRQAREQRLHGRQTSYETRLRRADGALISAQVTGVPRLRNEEIIGGIAVVSDVTERRRAEEALKESEERFRQLAENVDHALWVTDPAGSHMLYISPAYEQIWGRSRDSLYQDPQSWLAAIHPEDRELVRREQEKKQRGDYNVEYRIVRPDGTLRWVQSRAFPVRNERGEVYRIVGISLDISERKEVERLKNEFISTVSHELRTPLTSIRGALGLVVGGVAGALPPQARGMLDIALKNSERLVRLINDILDIEKIESGRLAFSLAPLELQPLVEQALEANRDYAVQLNVQLVLQQPLPGVRVLADPDRLMQVLANLLSNAAKFSPPGAPVEVALQQLGTRVRVTVRDHGPGIPANFRSRVFQKFAQADSSDTRQKGGTGLGLSIARAIVERLGGELDFEDAPGGGTSFFFELPEWQPLLQEPAALFATPRGGRVLICEDDHDVALLLSMMLQQSGFSSDIAYSAAQARALLEQGQYVALTLDLLLPDQDGVTLIQQLRADERTRALPIVVVSAEAENGRQALNGSALAVVDWLAKPIDAARLAAAVRQAARLAHGGKPRLLHVEDDADVRQVVAAVLQEVADVDAAEGLATARARLAEVHYHLVILDLHLPDGSGLDLVPLLNSQEPPIPVVIFSVEELSQHGVSSVAASLVKSQTSNSELLQTITVLINSWESPPGSAPSA